MPDGNCQHNNLEDQIVIKEDGIAYKHCLDCDSYIENKESYYFLQEVARLRKSASY